MIYLIDDNQNNQRQINYNITYIEEGVFDGFLTSIEKLNPSESFSEIKHLDFLKTADCILLHSSTEDFDLDKGFIPGSRSNSIKIKEVISQEGDIIPLVLFSNSMGNPDFDNHEEIRYIRGIKKNLFYERLYDFLERYQILGKVDLKILALGKNYASEETIKFGVEVLTALQGKGNTDFLQLSDIMPVKNSFKNFIENALSPSDFEKIISSLESQNIQVQDFKKKINLITESYIKYGKNIYPWK
jgi:hypothetical protein